MDAQPGNEKLHPGHEHLPLFCAFPARLFQVQQWQTVSERGISAHHLQPGAEFIKGLSSQHYT